jgi:hypothetical protein
MRVTTDGGKTWWTGAPPVSGPQFSNPFVMDPLDSRHLLTAGREVVETVEGAETCKPGLVPDPLGVGLVLINDPTIECSWKEVFNLGTKMHPGDAAAEVEDGDIANSMSAVDLYGNAAYVGFCGTCSVMNDDIGFASGLATNVGGSAAPSRMTSNGWHIATARGLPNRTITSVAIDPRDVRTVYVTLGGYDRGWRPPGSYRDANKRIGRGHVFKSTNAGASFVDVSGSLPNVPANWVTLRGSQLVVGNEVGVFLSSDADGSAWAALDAGMPAVPVTSLQVAPGNPNVLLASTFGRGFFVYEFPGSSAPSAPKRPANVLGKRVERPLPATGVDDQAGLVLLVLAAVGAMVTRRVLRGAR